MYWCPWVRAFIFTGAAICAHRSVWLFLFVFLSLKAVIGNPAILADICWSWAVSLACSTMESSVVHIYKEDRCPSGQPEECIPNFTWQPDLSEVFNYTANGTWDAEPEPMSPIIPIIVAVYSVVFVVGLAGNCLVMYVIIRWVFPDVTYSVLLIAKAMPVIGTRACMHMDHKALGNSVRIDAGSCKCLFSLCGNKQRWSAIR